MPKREVSRLLGGLLLAALLLAGWEASGWDLVVSGWFGNASGFAWRDHPFTRDLLHDGGRWLAAAVLVLLVVDAIRPLVAGPARRQRWLGIALVLPPLAVVPALKRLSSTSCPWDLAAFGGTLPYVPHWLPGVTDGGSGHCFPSGHAVAAFALWGTVFAWHEARPGLARAWFVGVALVGLLFGWAQLARGAHFVSHTLWSAWLCAALAAAGWMLAGAGARLAERSAARRWTAASGAGTIAAETARAPRPR